MLKSQKKQGPLKPGRSVALVSVKGSPPPSGGVELLELPPMVDLVDGVDTSLRELEIPAGDGRAPLRPWRWRKMISRYDTPERVARRVGKAHAMTIRVFAWMPAPYRDKAAGPSMRLLSLYERTVHAAAIMARDITAPAIGVTA